MSEHVIVERRGPVQLIRMNRPEKKNALTRAMYGAMAGALTGGDADDDVRVHLLLGVPGAFTAGNDIADFLAYATGGDLGGEVFDFLIALATAEKPIVAGVDGVAVGVGTTMQFHCDVTLASPRALFRTPFVDLGLVPEAGSSLLAPLAIGPQNAFALLALGEDFPAERALSAGIVAGIIPEDGIEAAAIEKANAIAARPPEALKIARNLLHGNREAVVERIGKENSLLAQRLKSPEAIAAFTAFLNRR